MWAPSLSWLTLSSNIWSWIHVEDGAEIRLGSWDQGDLSPAQQGQINSADMKQTRKRTNCYDMKDSLLTHWKYWSQLLDSLEISRSIAILFDLFFILKYEKKIYLIHEVNYAQSRGNVLRSAWNLIIVLYVCSFHFCFQVWKNLFMRVVHLYRLLRVP